jgi:Sec-independent protein secretion pathway component TatC
VVIVVVDTLAVIWVAAMLWMPGWSFRMRANQFLLLIYSLGAWFLFKIGSTGLIYLMAVPVFAAFLYSLQEAVRALLLSSVTCFWSVIFSMRLCMSIVFSCRCFCAGSLLP